MKVEILCMNEKTYFFLEINGTQHISNATSSINFLTPKLVHFLSQANYPHDRCVFMVTHFKYSILSHTIEIHVLILYCFINLQALSGGISEIHFRVIFCHTIILIILVTIARFFKKITQNIYCTHQSIVWVGLKRIAHSSLTRCQLEQLKVWALKPSEHLLTHLFHG